MSHFTKLESANIVSAKAFEAAVRELGFTNIKHNSTTTDYYGKTIEADVVASGAGKYDVALKKNGEGKYDMLADWWGIRTHNNMKEFAGLDDRGIQNKILRHTTKHTIVDKYRREGYRASVQDDGKQLRIQLSKA
jgi:hypothetical protein